MTVIHWTALPGNKFVKKLQPAMLSPIGYVTLQSIRLVGKKRDEPRELVRVIYDREYVIERLRCEILEPLQIESLDGWQQLMLEVWMESQAQLPQAG